MRSRHPDAYPVVAADADSAPPNHNNVGYPKDAETSMRALVALALIALLSASHASAGGHESDESKKVQKSVDRALKATSQDEQQAAFDEIVSLGCRAVPDIVAAMDDDRILPVAYIRLENDDPNAFEAFRQYGPQTVTDALAAILNHMTWKDFGFIYNGASAVARKRAIAGWRAFVRETPSKHLCDLKRSGGPR